MPGINTLTHIVYCLCNNLEQDNPNLAAGEQYEAKRNELLKEECLTKEVVFKTALDIINEGERKEYLIYILHSLSIFSNMIELRLMNKETDKNTQVVLLLEVAFDVIERLTTFFYDHFPDTLSMDIDTENPDADVKFKLGISVPQMAVFTNALANFKEITNIEDEKIIVRFVIRHFSSKYTNKISFKSFLNQFRKPEPTAVKRIIEMLEKMIIYLNKL